MEGGCRLYRYIQSRIVIISDELKLTFLRIAVTSRGEEQVCTTEGASALVFINRQVCSIFHGDGLRRFGTDVLVVVKRDTGYVCQPGEVDCISGGGNRPPKA